MKCVFSPCLILTRTGCYYLLSVFSVLGKGNPAFSFPLFSALHLQFLLRMYDEVSLHVLGWDPFPTMSSPPHPHPVLRDTLLIAMSDSLAVLGETCLNTCLTHIWILFAHILF